MSKYKLSSKRHLVPLETTGYFSLCGIDCAFTLNYLIIRHDDDYPLPYQERRICKRCRDRLDLYELSQIKL